MRAVDTNILVRVITRDDSQQLRASEAYISRGAWVSTVVLAETSWVLQAVYGLGDDQLATAIEMLLSHQHFSLQDPDVVSAALRHFRTAQAPGFTDCLILEIARKAGHLPVGTFDKRLGKVEGAERL
jgi:predicted nucleic-acid-binding protein